MKLPTADELVAAMDQKRQTDLSRAETKLFDKYGLEPLVPGFIGAFPQIRNAAGRNSILFWLIRFARTHAGVVDLALIALKDPAYMVRMQACAILAYSLRRDAVPALKQLLRHRDKKTRDDAAAAIDAIRNQNHHYWFDRDHSGDFFWSVNPQEDGYF